MGKKTQEGFRYYYKCAECAAFHHDHFGGPSVCRECGATTFKRVIARLITERTGFFKCKVKYRYQERSDTDGAKKNG